MSTKLLRVIAVALLLLGLLVCGAGAKQAKLSATEELEELVDTCTAKKERIEARSRQCDCNGSVVETCLYECEEDAGTSLDCVNGTLSGGVCSTRAACPSVSEVIEYTAPGQCSNYLPCQPCTPNCEDGYYYQGEANVCFENSTGWYTRGECKYLGVHRVGIGVYVLNVGSISLQDNSFYVDFLLTVLTEDKSFRSYDDAIKTFGRDQTRRECSPKLGGDAVSSHLGSGPNNGYKALSPTQFLRSLNLLNSEDNDKSEDKLDMSFITMDRLTLVSKVKYNADTTNWRVQGKAYFKPQLANWPFDTQRLEIMIEDLEQTLNTNVTFVMCHMATYSGLSPNIRFPDHEKQLHFDATAAELCWPPFNDNAPWAKINRTKTYPSLANPAVRGDHTCNKRGGLYASSRYIAYIEYSAPKTQRFMKTYLPVCLITYINSMSYILPVEDYSQRITICTGTLTALVLFHVSLDTQLPSSETITLADNLLIYSYGLNFISWILTITIMLLFKAQNPLSRPIALVSRWCGPIVTLAVIARLTGFEAEDYHHPAPKLVGPIIGAIVGGLTARGLEVWVAKKWAAYFSGLSTPKKKKTKHPAEKFRMRALGVRQRRRKPTSDDTEEQLLRSPDTRRDYSD